MGGREGNDILISFPICLLAVILDFYLGYVLSYETEESLESLHCWSCCEVGALFHFY